MTSKKDPPAKPPSAPADPLEGQPIEVVLEVLATVAGKQEGLEGAVLKQHVRQAVANAQRIVADVDRQVGEERQRKAAAAEIETIIDTLIRSGTAIGKELEKQRSPVVNAFKAADIQALAAGMKKLVAYMTDPTSANDKEAKALLAELELAMGPVFGIDPEAAENARREQMKEDVRRTMDAAFRGKDFAATLRKK